MSKIRIKNFGPVKEGYQDGDGWLDVKKVTVFIGNQGSGKSVVAKLISTFLWIEKALTRGDYNIKHFQGKNKLKNPYLKYHRLDNYFTNAEKQDIVEINYKGDSYYINYENGNLSIEEARNGSYPLPQIMYVPAERNFTADVKNPRLIKLTSESMIEFVTELTKALDNMKGPIRLPINDVDVEYNKQFDIIYIKGKVNNDQYKIKLSEASSGFQSLVPLYLVSWYLSNSVKLQSESAKEPMSSDELARFKKGVEAIWSDISLNDEQRRAALSVLSSKFNKTAFINIIEEPEQNLFPTSQWQMLKSLLEFNNINPGNKLIMTTHSPYLINYLSIAIQGAYLAEKVKKSCKQYLIEKIERIVLNKSIVSASDVIVYQFDETNGIIKKLPNIEGIPSDKNYLNQSLRQGNEMFDKLLEIEEEL
ncbi:MAG: ATP-binding protein [Bacteroidia bacterium]|nr:ATP-binding protein [Bacteroidia bacterium]